MCNFSVLLPASLSTGTSALKQTSIEVSYPWTNVKYFNILCHTVEPVLKDHSAGHENVAS